MENLERVRVVLVEDQDFLRREYARSLIRSGFHVSYLSDGCLLEGFLKKKRVDIVLSDTDMDKLDGPEAVKGVLENGLIGDDVLVIGMSDDTDNKNRWRGIAHYDCFFDKDYFPYDKIGKKVRNAYNAFTGLCNGWRVRIPVV